MLSYILIINKQNIDNHPMTDWLAHRPLLVQVVTARMESVKEAGADTPPTRRRPWRNYMSASLMIVTEQWKWLNQRRLVQRAVAPEAKTGELELIMKLAGAMIEMMTMTAVRSGLQLRRDNSTRLRVTLSDVAEYLAHLVVDIFLSHRRELISISSRRYIHKDQPATINIDTVWKLLQLDTIYNYKVLAIMYSV